MFRFGSTAPSRNDAACMLRTHTASDVLNEGVRNLSIPGFLQGGGMVVARSTPSTTASLYGWLCESVNIVKVLPTEL